MRKLTPRSNALRWKEPVVSKQEEQGHAGWSFERQRGAGCETETEKRVSARSEGACLLCAPVFGGGTAGPFRHRLFCALEDRGGFVKG